MGSKANGGVFYEKLFCFSVSGSAVGAYDAAVEEYTVSKRNGSADLAVCDSPGCGILSGEVYKTQAAGRVGRQIQEVFLCI